MSLSLQTILTVIFVALAGIAYVVLKGIQKIHKNDPEFQRKQAEREAEYKRQLQEDEELYNMVNDNSNSYNEENMQSEYYNH